MIPKIIHYCWFGRGIKPKMAQKCIESWKKWCPDYKIMEWNEDNFDINSNRYVREAYEARKFAFVTDYVRLWAMTKYGGIYMDTDVEVIRSLDFILKHEAASGFESATQIQTGLMACREGFPLFEEFLRFYDNASFLNENGTLNLTTNVVILTNICLEHGFIPNGKYQVIEGFVIYPPNVFCPDHKRLTDAVYMADTAAIHYFAGSWKSASMRKRENSLWWKVIAIPGMRISILMTSLFGDKWLHVKKKLWSRIIQEKV